jgi:hypothetical protein
MSDFETYLIPIEIVRKVNNSINFVMFQAVIEVVAQVVDIHTLSFSVMSLVSLCSYVLA